MIMLDTKDKLKDCLNKEKSFYITRKSRHDQIVEWFVKDPSVRIWQYQKTLRYTEYYYCQKGLKKLIMYPICRHRRNRLGLKLGIEMVEGSFAPGLIIHHSGNIVVNGWARIGKDCQLHGDNCIGNNGKSLKAPRLGNRIDIGVGAKIIGDIELADDIVIGAGAVVNKSFLTPGITIGGIPAQELKKGEFHADGK